MRETGQGQLCGPAAATRLVRALEYLYLQPGPGQRQRRRKAVGPGPDDDGVKPGQLPITSPSAASSTGTGLLHSPAASFSSSLSVRSGR